MIATSRERPNVVGKRTQIMLAATMKLTGKEIRFIVGAVISPLIATTASKTETTICTKTVIAVIPNALPKPGIRTAATAGGAQSDSSLNPSFKNSRD